VTFPGVWAGAMNVTWVEETNVALKTAGSVPNMAESRVATTAVTVRGVRNTGRDCEQCNEKRKRNKRQKGGERERERERVDSESRK